MVEFELTYFVEDKNRDKLVIDEFRGVKLVRHGVFSNVFLLKILSMRKYLILINDRIVHAIAI